MKITRYLRTYPRLIAGWPFTLVGVNHLRAGKDEGGNPIRLLGGGEHIKFQEFCELELKKIGGHKKKIECAGYEGVPIQISCEKNSFGPTHRRIQTRVLWKYRDNDDGTFTQESYWDWDWATVDLLYNLMHGERSSAMLKQSLTDIDFHLECPSTSPIENSAWTKLLGMKEKDAMPWADLGALIREDAGLMKRLRQALRINERPLLQGDYLEQIDGLKESSL